MSDYKTFVKMLDDAMVAFDWKDNDDETTEISIEAGVAENNHGYSGFVTSFTFSKEGKLLHVGVWE